MRLPRPEHDGRTFRSPKFVQPDVAAPRPDPVAGRFASFRQAAAAVGWSRAALAAAIERDPSLAAWAGPEPTVDLDRLERSAARGRGQGLSPSIA